MAKEKTYEELKEFHDKFTENPRGLAYASTQKQFTALCNSFAKENIDVREDSALFKNFLDFTKNSLKIIEDMDEMMKGMDAEKARELREQQKQTGKRSLEAMLEKQNRGNV